MMQMNMPDQNEVTNLALHHLDPGFVRQSPQALMALKKLLNDTYGTASYMDLVARYELPSENERLLKLALSQSSTPMGRQAGQQLLRQGGSGLIMEDDQRKKRR
jgi:hypothetical protein